jgi:hypothetical protein
MQMSMSPPGGEVADAAAVDAALLGLELVDDLHGADLGRAGDGAGGEAGEERGEGVVVLRELALDVRDDVHDVGVALDHELLGRRDRADAATRPTSLRPRSRSIRCSARSLGSARSSASSAASSSGVAPRGACRRAGGW